MRFRNAPVLALVLALVLTFPIAAQLSVGPERAVSTPLLGPASYATPVAVASSGDMLLVVWSELRGQGFTVHAARVVDGVVLDPTGITLSTAWSYGDLGPRAVWDGENFVIVWNEYEYGVSLEGYAVRLTRDGEIVTRSRLPLHVYVDLAAADGRIAAIAAREDGTVTAGEFDAQLQFAAVQPVEYDTTLGTGAAGIVLLTAFRRADQRMVGVDVQPFHRRGPSSGVRLERADLVTYAAAASGGDTLVVTTGATVQVTRIRPDGSHRRVAEIHAPRALQQPVVHADGSYDILVADEAQLLLHHFSANDDAEGVAFAGTLSRNAMTPTRAAAHAAKGATLVASTVGSVEGRFPFEGLQTFPISQRAAKQTMHAIADGGTSLLAVWSEDRGYRENASSPPYVRGASYLVGMAMHRDGTPAGAPFVITQTPGTVQPAVTFDGRDFVVLWTEQFTSTAVLRARWIGGSATEIIVAPRAGAAAIASNGQSVLAAYSNTDGLHDDLQVRALPDGREIAVPGARWNPAIAASGAHYLIAAQGDDDSIRAALVDGGGNVLRAVDAAPAGARNPAVASNGSAFLVVYERDGAIFGTIVSRDGRASGIESRLATPSSGVLQRPRVVWDGATFVISFTLTLPNRSDVHARRIDGNGKPLGDVVAISKTAAHEVGGALLPVSPGVSLAGYSRVAPEATGTSRMFTRVLAAPKRRASGR